MTPETTPPPLPPILFCPHCGQAIFSTRIENNPPPIIADAFIADRFGKIE